MPVPTTFGVLAGHAPLLVPTTWNPADKAADCTLTNSNRTCENVGGGGTFNGVRSIAGKTTGKFYWEYLMDGIGSVTTVGGANMAFSLTTTTGVDNFGIVSSGFMSVNDVTLISGATYTTGDRISIAMDMDNKRFWGRINGGAWNYGIGSADPATNTAGLDLTPIIGGALFALVTGFPPSKVTANFGSGMMIYGVPTGFLAGLPV